MLIIAEVAAKKREDAIKSKKLKLCQIETDHVAAFENNIEYRDLE